MVQLPRALDHGIRVEFHCGLECGAGLQSSAAMSSERPKLSICIPTYSRASLLDVCLATVLPQVADWAEHVECVICDNASTDATAEVVQRYAAEFPLRYVRNETNIGVLGNVTKVAGQLAKGEFVWLIGDDDCLMQGAVAQVLSVLESDGEIDLLTVNVGFRATDFRPNPSEALGGITGKAETVLRDGERSGVFAFADLLTHPNANFTAMYSVVLRQSCWASEFPNPYTGEPFIDVRSTYPHAHIIAKTQVKKRVALIAEPLVMLHELSAEEFSWARYQPLTVCLRLTELINEYAMGGVPDDTLRPFYDYQVKNRGQDLGRLLWNERSVGGWRDAIRFLWMLRRFPFGVIKLLSVAMLDDSAPRWLSAPFRLLVGMLRLLRPN